MQGKPPGGEAYLMQGNPRGGGIPGGNLLVAGALLGDGAVAVQAVPRQDEVLRKGHPLGRLFGGGPAPVAVLAATLLQMPVFS